MRLPALAALSVLALAGAADARPRQSGESQLASLLSGRVAEQPVSCIRTLPSSELKVIDGTAIVFGRGKTIYVNRTRDPRSINDRHTLVMRKFGSGTELCRTDIVTTVDATTHTYTGNVFLADFVPYRRAGR